MFLPDCIWVWIFSTTSPSWMMSCVTLMPVISVKALASTFDSYSWVVMVSETTLISMPLKGFGGLDEPLHLLHLVVLGQRRRLELAVDPLLGGGFVRIGRRSDRSRSCHQRDALVIIRRRSDQVPCSSQASHVGSSVAATDIDQARVDPGSALLRLAQTERNTATAETSEITVASHRLDNSMPSADRKRRERVGADEADPQRDE